MKNFLAGVIVTISFLLLGFQAAAPAKVEYIYAVQHAVVHLSSGDFNKHGAKGWRLAHVMALPNKGLANEHDGGFSLVWEKQK